MTIHFSRIVLAFLCCLSSLAFVENGHEEKSADIESIMLRRDVLEWISRFYPEPGEIDPVEKYGAAVLPVVTDLLSKPEQVSDQQVNGALGILIALNQTYIHATPKVEPYLRASAWQTREVAVNALAAVGSKSGLPTFVTMLYDVKDTVRYQAVMAIGKFGEKSSLTAFTIWRMQAAASDEQRPEIEKWVDGRIRNAIDHASTMIRDRIAKDEFERSQLPLNTTE
tara:strand:- start:1377 stop:2051 length:675 start_codon:yes stop_codon:yes gene_type:complete